MPSLTLQHLLITALLAGGVATAAGLLRLLAFSGALAAFAIGFFVFAFGGLPFGIPLLAFFISSSILSRLGSKRKAVLNARYDKSSNRDAGQVLANGGVAAALAIVFVFTPFTRDTMLLYLAALAAVNADTWATEIGGLARSRPILVSTLRRVDPGTSGAVSLYGLLASLLGAFFIAGSGWLAWPANAVALLWRIDTPEVIAVTWAGFVAAYADSLIGATVQVQYRCSRCGALTERRSHCGVPGKQARGVKWVTNDVVNFTTSLCGVLFAWVLLRFFAYPL